MRIEWDNEYKQSISCKDIKQGECFQVFSKVHIMCDYESEHGSGRRFCADLATGTIYDYEPLTIVRPVSAKVVVGG